MTACTFFGHRECSCDVNLKLRTVLEKLIKDGVGMFYVGNQGSFDKIVRNVLFDLKKEFPHIKYYVVLAYVPKENEKDIDFSESLIPDGIEEVFPKFAISWRNRWMIKQSDYVVAYVTHPGGGASKFMELAIKQNKRVINIGK